MHDDDETVTYAEGTQHDPPDREPFHPTIEDVMGARHQPSVPAIVEPMVELDDPAEREALAPAPDALDELDDDPADVRDEYPDPEPNER
jgi:hypothetical protein